ncbi:ABC transporter B family member 9, partial [Mucuna pruriens]
MTLLHSPVASLQSLREQETLLPQDQESTSQPPVLGPENTQEMARQQESKKNKVKDQSNKTVPFYKLFSFADSWDYLLMFVGTVSAAGNGLTKALTNIVMGEAVDAFRGNGNTNVVREVSK